MKAQGLGRLREVRINIYVIIVNGHRHRWVDVSAIQSADRCTQKTQLD